ncbi:MAG TPA: methylated-DNA--[protein]-cysteine S-methyltransferase [Sphingomonadales bacterium]|nr:methylated-DNA--[protein]-cysteine S-methyltransferase [Sphingomonadales bacterium]
MTAKAPLFRDRLDTPLGPLTLVWGEKGLRAAEFGKSAGTRLKGLLRSGAENPYRKAFLAYFAGNLDAFASLTFDPEGTGFQKRVWQRLLAIPPGETRNYSDIARGLGMPFAARAVGAANGQNPIAIAVPCHRVIGKDGTLTGYAGGLKRKAWLLCHEKALTPARPGY